MQGGTALEMQSMRTRRAHIGACPTGISRLGSQWDFSPVLFQHYLNSQLRVARNSLMFSTLSVALLDLIDHY